MNPKEKIKLQELMENYPGELEFTTAGGTLFALGLQADPYVQIRYRYDNLKRPYRVLWRSTRDSKRTGAEETVFHSRNFKHRAHALEFMRSLVPSIQHESSQV